MQARQGWDWYGVVWSGNAGEARHGKVRQCKAMQAWQGDVWHGRVRRGNAGEVWHDTALHGMERSGRQGTVWSDMARQCRRDKTWIGKSRSDKVGRGR